MCPSGPREEKLPGTPGNSLQAGHLLTHPSISSSSGILGLLWGPELASVFKMVPTPTREGLMGSL